VLAAALAISLVSAAAGQSVELTQRALQFEQGGKFREAATAWRDVVKSNPRDAAAWGSLGVVLSRLQQYQDAVAAYRKAIALNPKLPFDPIKDFTPIALVASNPNVLVVPPSLGVSSLAELLALARRAGIFLLVSGNTPF